MEETKDILVSLDTYEDLITEILSIKIPTQTLGIEPGEPSNKHDQMIKDMHTKIMQLASPENLKIARENPVIGELFVMLQNRFNKFKARQEKEKKRHWLAEFKRVAQ